MAYSNLEYEIEQSLNTLFAEPNSFDITNPKVIFNYIKPILSKYDEKLSHSITWSVDDFLGRAAQRDIDLTDEQAEEALDMMIQKHDCELGITWDTVDYWIDYIKSEKKLNNEE